MTKSKPKAKKATTPGKNDAPAQPRQVVYPELSIALAIGPEAITVKQAKDALGWEEVAEKDDSCVPEVSALVGKGVRLLNDTKNRYFTTAHLLTLKQEVLQRRWRFNGNSIIIGNTGLILDGQYRLAALVLAGLEWAGGEQKEHWHGLWPEEPTLESVIVYGVNEDDDTFKTFNQGKPGTLAEILYRSDYFVHLPPAERKIVSRMTGYAVKLLWERTGAKNDPFAPRRTPGEALDFIARHLKILEAVKYIRKENRGSGKEGPPERVGRWLSAGYASAFLYLMGCSSTNIDDYITQPHAERSEADLRWSNWDLACAFWSDLAGSSPSLEPIREAIRKSAENHSGSGASADERMAILAKAWLQFSKGQSVTPASLKLKFKTEEDDEGHVISSVLADWPQLGGIDQGRAPEANEEPTLEEIEQRKEEEKRRKDQIAELIKRRRQAKKEEPAEAKEPDFVSNGGKGPRKPPIPKAKNKPAATGQGAEPAVKNQETEN